MTKYRLKWYFYRILCYFGIHNRWDVYNCGLYEQWVCCCCRKKELRPKWNLIIDHKAERDESDE
jgi:hypothetical protein